MKYNLPFLWTAIAVLGISTLNAQNYSAARKVYYTPITDKIYFAIDMNPVKENPELGSVDEGAPLYQKNGDYKPGDVLRILVKAGLGPGDEAEYFYIKIVGRVSEEIMSRVDQKIKERSASLFGEGKLEPWPDKFIEDKGIRGKVPNEQGVDSDFYILSSVENFTPNIMGEYYQGMGSTGGDCSNLVIFYLGNIGTGRFAVKEMGSFTSSFCRVNIHWKEKPDKKGKKVGGASVMDLTREGKAVTSTYEKEIDFGNGKYTVVGWPVMDGMAGELVKKKSEYFEANVMKAIDKAFEMK